MPQPSNTFSARPASTAFPAAARAADYDEDVSVRTHGTRPRRSERVAPPAPASPASGEETKAEAASDTQRRSAPAPEPTTVAAHTPTDRATPRVESDLFTGAPSSTADDRRLVLARTGVRGALNRVGLRLRPAAAEAAALRQQQEIERASTAIRQASWSRAVSVLIANPKGGTGKTPLALLLGGALGATRGGSVAVLEVADDPGALAYRAEGDPRRGVGELVRDADRIRTAGQLAGYTAAQTSFASVIGTIGRRPRLDAQSVAAMVRVIDEYYTVRVMDSGNQPTSSAFTGALAATDVLVVPIVNAGDSTLEAVRMLEGMAAEGGHAAELAGRAVIARLTDGRPESETTRAEVSRIFTDLGVAAICDLPYDPHIAERGQLTYGHLAPPTAAAFVRLAGVVVELLNAQVDRETKEVSA